jgi:peptidoglycan/LPS O-acetylase OafA/YrhL
MYGWDISSKTSNLFYQLIQLKFIAIDIFFIISGYLSMKWLMNHEHDTSPAKTYLQSRLQRIIPPYYTLILAVLLVNAFLPEITYTFSETSIVLNNGIRSSINFTPGSSQFSHESIFPYFFFLQNLNLASSTKMLRHLWFIAVLVHYHLIFTLVIWGSRALFKNVRPFSVVTVALIVIIIATQFMRAYAGINHANYYQMTPFRIDAIAWGGLLFSAHLFMQQNAFYLIARRFFLPIGMIIFGVILFFAPYHYNISNHPHMFIASYVSFGLMIIGVQEWKVIDSMFSSNPLSYIGRHSYGIFLFHFPIMYFYTYARNYYDTNKYLSIFIYLLIAIGLSICAENIIHRIKNIFYDRAKNKLEMDS